MAVLAVLYSLFTYRLIYEQVAKGLINENIYIQICFFYLHIYLFFWGFFHFSKNLAKIAVVKSIITGQYSHFLPPSVFLWCFQGILNGNIDHRLTSKC